MIIVDVETSGSNPQSYSILSIGAVDFDDPKNFFYGECRLLEGAHVDEKALQANGFTKEQIHDPKKKTVQELIEAFIYWTKQCPNKTLAGHNTHFDHAFLQHSAYLAHIDWPFSFRIVDLHSLCYAHLARRSQPIPQKDGRSLLNSDFVFTYVGLPAEPKPHNGLTGAKMEAEAFSRFFYKKNFLKEFKKYPIPDYL